MLSSMKRWDTNNYGILLLLTPGRLEEEIFTGQKQAQRLDDKEIQ